MATASIHAPARIARIVTFALLGLLALLTLGGCTASAQVTEAGTQTMEVVRQISMFAAIALVFYWIVFVVLFGLRGLWPEGYSQLSQTWKPALFVTAFTIIAVPAALTWAEGIVTAGGF